MNNKDSIEQYGFSSWFAQWYADRIGKYGDANIIVVIVCASGKDSSAGHMQTENGRRVMFVANPQKAPPDRSIIYKRPDDLAYPGLSWREKAVQYNNRHKCDPSYNPFKLLPAWKLYKPRPPNRDIYRELVNTFSNQNIFILSAGWGLITTDFLTPNYDITFSTDTKKKKPWVFRSKGNRYDDLKCCPRIPANRSFFWAGKAMPGFLVP